MTDLDTAKAARLLKLFINPVCIRLLLAVAEAPDVPGTRLQQKVGISQALLSIHLNRMKDYGILTSRIEGKRVFYSIDDLEVLKAIETMINRTSQASEHTL